MLFVILFILLLFMVLVLNGARFSNPLNPITLFCVPWACVAALANSGAYGLYEPSASVNIVILAGSLAFLLACFAFPGNNDGYHVNKGCIAGQYCNIKLILFFWLAAVVILLPILPRALQIIQNEGWARVRALNYDPSRSYINTLETYALNYICVPVLYATEIVGALLLVCGDGRGVGIVVLGFIGAILEMIVTAGRTALFFQLFVLLVAFVMSYTPKQKEEKGMKKGTAIIIMILIVVLYLTWLLTKNRPGSSQSILQSVFFYFNAGPTYLSQLLTNASSDYTPLQSLMFGWATFGFIANLPSFFLSVIGIKVYGSTYWISSAMASRYYYVTPVDLCNAMRTCYFDFIMDWGYLGAIIGPTMLAIISMLLIKKINSSNRKLMWASLSLYWSFVLFRTIFRWELLDISPFQTIVLLILFTNKVGAKTNGRHLTHTMRDVKAHYEK